MTESKSVCVGSNPTAPANFECLRENPVIAAMTMDYEIDSDEITIRGVNISDIPWDKIKAACAYAESRLGAKLGEGFTIDSDRKRVVARWAGNGIPEEQADDAWDIMQELDAQFG